MDELYRWSREVGAAWTEALGVPVPKAPPLAPTPREELALEGGAKLYHFYPRDERASDARSTATSIGVGSAVSEARSTGTSHGSAASKARSTGTSHGSAATEARSTGTSRSAASNAADDRAPLDAKRPRTPILLIPSMINRWYVLDLRSGASLVEALVGAGLDVWCLDWGVPEAEDRYLDWEMVVARLGRAVRRVRRETGASRIGMFGYCMGGTLTTIYAAQHADEIAALVTLAAPIDFSRGGLLRGMVDPEWFDASAVADAGNVAPQQMQAGFVALRPTLDAAKLVSLPDLAFDDRARSSFLALEEWAGDNIPFPGAAYRRYIGELYQGNELVGGTHRVAGKRVDLGAIRCPTLVITASRDTICPASAATALLEHVGATDKTVLEVAGGHVGAVVGSRAAREMYPALAEWLVTRLPA